MSWRQRLLGAADVWSAFRTPEMPDERRAAEAMWAQLPEDLKTRDQALGKHSAGCSATYGVMEACDFKCTACYLTDIADNTPPLPMPEIKAQLDQIRQHLGPWGNTQITAGEVTLLPCDDLVEILRYCREVQLSPMLMTNGQTILKDPSYLERLVLEGGLDKVAIHIDTTQKGRLGLRARDTEADIHWIRDAFANLIRQTRRRTGKPLSASHTFTVTEKNFAEIPEVMRWMLDNTDAFRMISLQPTADVGRTREGEQIGRQRTLWDQVSEGVGVRMNRHPVKFGHPDCNSLAMSFVVTFDNGREMERHIMEVTRDGESQDAEFIERLLNEGFAGFSPDGESGPMLLARLAGRFRKSPHMLGVVARFCASRVWSERPWLPRLMQAAMAGRRWSITPLIVVVHNFMSAHELETEVGQARLAACSFRVPVDGRMVSMCELNGTELRRTLNHRDQDRLITIKEPVRRAG